MTWQRFCYFICWALITGAIFWVAAQMVLGGGNG